MSDGRLVIRIVRGLVRIVVGIGVVGYTLLDALLFPLVRPLLGWLGRLRVFERLGRAIGQLPPYAALVALAVPFAAIEPAKVYALYLVAIGQAVAGIGLLILAQVLSLLVCERIYHAAHAPLMRIGWFRALMGWVTRLRDRALGWIRATAAWRLAAQVAKRVRDWLLGLFGAVR